MYIFSALGALVVLPPDISIMRRKFRKIKRKNMNSQYFPKQFFLIYSRHPLDCIPEIPTLLLTPIWTYLCMPMSGRDIVIYYVIFVINAIYDNCDMYGAMASTLDCRSI